MKKLLALLLAVVMVLCLWACGSENTDETGSTQSDVSGETTGSEGNPAVTGGDLTPDLPSTEGDLEEFDIPASGGNLVVGEG